MTHQEVLTSLKKKDYKPLYLLHGDEAYFIDQVVDKIEHGILSEAEKSFNFSVFYGKDTDVNTLIDSLRRYPMMAAHQVVILKEAQEMRSLTKLESYINKPTTTTIFCIVHKHKKLDRRTKFAKAFAKNGLVVESKKLYDNQIPAWIESYLKTKKRPIEQGATELVAEYLGGDLSKVANELDKLCISIPEGTKITTKTIENNIGISKDYNVFELQNALCRKDGLKANRIVDYFIANPKSGPFVMVLGALYNYFSKVYMLSGIKQLSDAEQAKTIGLRSSYFLKDYKLAVRNYNKKQLEEIFKQLHIFDLKAKGVGNVSTPQGELLKELIWRILNAA